VPATLTSENGLEVREENNFKFEIESWQFAKCSHMQSSNDLLNMICSLTV